MIDKSRLYSFKELLHLYAMLNIEFKYFGQNEKGDIILYMVTSPDVVTIFLSNNDGKTKKDYLNLSDEEIENLKFKYYMEVKMQDYDINVLVNTSTTEKIPSGRYSIETLNNLTEKYDQDNIRLNGDQINGIAYIVVEKNSNSTLFSGVYEFGNGGLLNDIKNNLLPKYQEAKNKIVVNNINEFLKLFDDYNLNTGMEV